MRWLSVIVLPHLLLAQMKVEYNMPNWVNSGTIQNYLRVSVNDYPVARQFGMNTLGVVEAIAGLVSVPANSTSTGMHAVGLAGYAITASPKTGAVGVFSGAHVAANNTNSFGFNAVITNCVAMYCSPADVFNYTNHWGAELDFNMHRLSDGSAPSSNVRGISLIGDSVVQPLGLVHAIDIDKIGISHNVPWKRGLYVNDRGADYPIYLDNGAASTGVGVYLGTSSTSGSAGSQIIRFTSRNALDVQLPSSLSTDADGNMAVSLTNGRLFAINGGGGIKFTSESSVIAGHYSTSVSWDVPLLLDGEQASTDVDLNGCLQGMPAMAGFSNLGTQDVLISAHVSEPNRVRVVIVNRNGGELDYPSGTLRVSCWA